MKAAAGEPRAGTHPEVPRLAEHLFRHEAGNLVSILTGIFGLDRLQMAEDVVQEALVRALQIWPYDGIPKNPAAWLMQTARHLALDLIRREKLFQEKEPQIATSLEQNLPDFETGGVPMFDDEIKDGRLRLIFACCHPVLPQEAQTALALKTLCGFGTAEIAKAFLTTRAAIAKRLTRARQRIQETKIPFEIPAGAELSARLDAVLKILYLLFNEGYKASCGESLVRANLCHEAIQLGMLLASHPATDQPRTHALLALMLFNSARLETRTDSEGNLLRLEEQDRSAWDHTLVALGIRHLRRAADGEELGEYHLQAGIAACHCTAPNYASTDWKTILAHYDQWLKINDSAVVALNRAIVVANLNGPTAGIRAVEAIRNRNPLETYYLTHAVLGDLHSQLRDFPTAAGLFRRALRLTDSKSEQTFLRKRIGECEAE